MKKSYYIKNIIQSIVFMVVLGLLDLMLLYHVFYSDEGFAWFAFLVVMIIPITYLVYNCFTAMVYFAGNLIILIGFEKKNSENEE